MSKRSFTCKINVYVSLSSNIFNFSEDFWSKYVLVDSQNGISTFKLSSGNTLDIALYIWFILE